MKDLDLKANANSWKRDPFQEGGESIPLKLEVSNGEMERIRYGFIPEEMEDKWFTYFEEPYVYMHRSWTGMPVYRVHFTTTGKQYVVTDAKLSKNYAGGHLEKEAEFAGYLLKGLMERPFPDQDPSMPTYLVTSTHLDRVTSMPLRIQMMEGDILSVYSDALVLSAFRSMYDPAPGTVFGRIHQTCGLSFGDHLPTGASAWGEGFHEFPAKENRSFGRLFVLDICDYSNEGSISLKPLAKSFDSLSGSIQQGCFSNLRSLSMPMLGTGAQGFEGKHVAKKMWVFLEAVWKHSEIELLRVFSNREEDTQSLAREIRTHL